MVPCFEGGVSIILSDKHSNLPVKSEALAVKSVMGCSSLNGGQHYPS